MSDSTSDSSASRNGLLFLYRELWRFAQGERRKLGAAMALLIGAQVLLLLLASASMLPYSFLVKPLAAR